MSDTTRRGTLARWAAVFSTVAMAVYPLVVLVSLMYSSARSAAWVLLVSLFAIVCVRVLAAANGLQWFPVVRPFVPTFAVLVCGIWLDDVRWLLLQPVLVNAALLVGFALTLRPGAMPMIERFARAHESRLPPGAEAHCRGVTIVWCCFFAFNIAMCSLLAWLGDVRVWAAYTGGVAYVLMGTLFAGEYLTRKLRFRRYGSGRLDRALAVLFPPRENGVEP